MKTKLKMILPGCLAAAFFVMAIILRVIPLSTATEASFAITTNSVYLEQGKSIQAEVANAPGTISWKSSDDSIAHVDSTGKITARKTKGGKVTISATVGNETAQKEMFVWNAKLSGGQYYTYSSAANAKKGTSKGKIAYGNKNGAMYFYLEKQSNNTYKISKSTI